MLRRQYGLTKAEPMTSDADIKGVHLLFHSYAKYLFIHSKDAFILNFNVTLTLLGMNGTHVMIS